MATLDSITLKGSKCPKNLICLGTETGQFYLLNGQRIFDLVMVQAVSFIITMCSQGNNGFEIYSLFKEIDIYIYGGKRCNV